MSTATSHRTRRLALSLYGAFFWLSGVVHGQSNSAASHIPFTAAAVSASGPDFVVSWRADHIQHVRILAATDPDHFDPERLVAEGSESGQATVSTLSAAPRWYFKLQPNRGEPLVIADRALHLVTAANFRDAGGYRTSDGRWVRMGLVYRSNGIEHLSDAELKQIENLHIKLVCDLRTDEERLRAPDRVPGGATDISADVLAGDADLIHSMIAGGSAATGVPASPLSKEDLEERIYRDFVRLPSARKAYSMLFERLADPTQLPTVFHCTAGKDRTGWAQAIFLTLLGVPRSTVVEDYVLTNQYLQGAALDSVHQSVRAASVPKITADPAALDAAFKEVAESYGSFGRYLHDGLHLSDATLAALHKNFLTQ
jgi:protein-tyrosine phosphatase